ncbi:MAG TPA: phosphomannomutase/phosphoglucomutase [Candidatus Pacearchaeota archaeon]|nr:phosphomannomutase/phosphoglucomutase [Candidatus Pacearchaeota archaeon]HOK94418.1 phosphomannomutase/phosphoglucomutase [Candidatus Pacearchaeota archaeon]
MNPEIFKAYDIRGIYKKDFDTKTAFKIGQAFSEFLKNNKRTPLTIIVGRDNRLSSASLAKAVKNGLKLQGSNVIDIGLSSTPMFYFGVNFLKADGGIMITASHNPPEYNGFKLVREEAIPISGDTGIEEIKKMILLDNFKKRKPGTESRKNILNEYIKFNLKFLDSQKVSSLKIVVDTANAVSSTLIPKIATKIKKIKFYHLFSDLDGHFPNHNPDPLVKENLVYLQKEVLKRKADFGVGFDGDGDRVIFVDEKGKAISGDLITALMAKIILREKPGEKILYDVRSSKIVPEVIKENKGIPIPSRVGHSFVKATMRQENIIFGGELSGHYYFRENHFCETPFFVLFKIIEEISFQKQHFSKIIKPFQKYAYSGEINFEIEDKKGTIKKIEEHFRDKNCKISRLDGTKIDFGDWWFLIRPSNTEPLLRLIVEAKDQKTLKEKIKEVEKIIK